MDRVFKNANINGKITDITVCDGVIQSLEKTGFGGTELYGAAVFPGLIDIHTHGCMGQDTMDGDLSVIAAAQAQHGTTAFLPTTMTATGDRLRDITKDLPDTGTARALGYHLEGPYLSQAFAGAQSPALVRPFDAAEYASFRHVKMITLAPECVCAGELQKIDAVVCIGHTACDYDMAMQAFQNGAVGVTHILNAMPPFHHRAPGVLGAALDADVFVQCICDGVHLHPATVRLLYRLFGKERLVLISDSMRATGLPDGDYELGGQRVQVKENIARLVDGTLAGSTSFLLDCVKKATAFGIPKDDALQMASSTPARQLHIRAGRLAPGYAADFFAADAAMNVLQTVVGGKTVYRR